LCPGSAKKLGGNSAHPVSRNSGAYIDGECNFSMFLGRRTVFPSAKTVFPLGETVFPLRETVFPLRETVFPLGETVAGTNCGFRNMFARGPNHGWPQCVHSASQIFGHLWNENFASRDNENKLSGDCHENKLHSNFAAMPAMPKVRWNHATWCERPPAPTRARTSRGGGLLVRAVHRNLRFSKSSSNFDRCFFDIVCYHAHPHFRTQVGAKCKLTFFAFTVCLCSKKVVKNA